MSLGTRRRRHPNKEEKNRPSLPRAVTGSGRVCSREVGMTAKHTALVLGASGIIGRNLLEYLDQREAWQVKAIARRAPGFETKADLRSM